MTAPRDLLARAGGAVAVQPVRFERDMVEAAIASKPLVSSP